MLDNFITIITTNPYDLDSVSSKLCNVLSSSKYLNISTSEDIDGAFWFCVLRSFLFTDEEVNINSLISLSKYIRKHFKATCKGTSCNKFNEVKYKAKAVSKVSGKTIAEIEFNKVCDEFIPLHYAYILLIKQIIDSGVYFTGCVFLEVTAEIEGETYTLGKAKYLNTNKGMKLKRFYNILETLIESYNLYMYSRFMNDYYSENSIYSGFLDDEGTVNFTEAYNKAVDFITEYNNIDVSDIPDFIEELKDSRIFDENKDIDTLIGEDFYLT